MFSSANSCSYSGADAASGSNRMSLTLAPSVGKAEDRPAALPFLHPVGLVRQKFFQQLLPELRLHLLELRADALRVPLSLFGGAQLRHDPVERVHDFLLAAGFSR